MRRRMKALVLTAVVAVVWTPAQARAEGFVSPWLGVNFAGGESGEEGDYAVGVNAGYMGAGIIGGEIEFGYSPDFFGEAADNHELDLMGNVIVGIPIGGTTGGGLRPYVTGGLGLVRTSFESSFIDSLGSNDFGFNLGVGVMGYFSDHFGLRGDIRYFRTVNSEDFDDPGFPDVDLGEFHFWRASVGVVFR
jgi:opacity protein-like surface antigen